MFISNLVFTSDVAPASGAEIQLFPVPAVEPVPAARGRAPPGTVLELEAAPEPSCPCHGTAQDQPSEELPAFMAPAVDPPASALELKVAGARGDREGVTSTAPASSSLTVPSPGLSGNHGGRNQGVQPVLLCLTGEGLHSFSRAAAQLLKSLLLLLLGVFACLQESRKRSL
ncbi:hypothetical protein H8959_003492 [Pygathrix nigripes]